MIKMVNRSRLFLQGRLLQGSHLHAAALVEVAAQLHYITKLHYIAKMHSHLIIMLGRPDVQCLFKQRRFIMQGRLLQGPLVHAAALVEAAAMMQDIVKLYYIAKMQSHLILVMLARRCRSLGLHRRREAQLDAGEATSNRLGRMAAV